MVGIKPLTFGFKRRGGKFLVGASGTTAMSKLQQGLGIRVKDFLF
jgi:hypothetical protein